MSMKVLKRLKADTAASTIVEFAIVAPAVLTLMIGVFQIALGMQAHNALRSIASDTARYAVVEYQKGNTVTDTVIATQAEAIGESSPYLLDANLTATVVDAPTQRVSGSFEKTITLTYTLPKVLFLGDWTSPTLTFSRPIFLLDD